MTSNDTRYGNAEHDIWQHTFNNDDYPDCWVLKMKDFIKKLWVNLDYLFRSSYMSV